ncbi:MerR family transcriptional regulator [Indioceanicola profundi]|uniref:MerR family transcriptional regulator n=1 Tax=Indioceanicola profundi TaxID=2220096 RepID=UPI000E6AA9A6|nr:MerR family transcriptional regulator [Indioceanicola profundi]
MADAADTETRSRSGKSATAFRTISEVSADLDVPQHVLRFWESKFPQIKPLKRGGGRRYYRPDDVELLRRIQVLLYKEGYTIKGVQRLLKESRGASALSANDASPDEDESEHAELTAQEAADASSALSDITGADAAPLSSDPAAEIPEAGSGSALPADKRRELEGILAELQAISRLLRS